MQIQQLEYVVKVAECGSISQAAQKLYLSQPSLTKSIMNLENEYGIKIFERTSKGIRLTGKGKEFIYYARHILTSVKTMNMVFSDDLTHGNNVLSVASQQLDFLYDLILDTQQKYQDDHFHFNIMELNRSDIVQAVLCGDANIGLIVRTNQDSKSFSWMMDKRNLEWHVVDTSDVFVHMGPLSEFHGRNSLTYDEIEGAFHIVLDMEREAIRDLYITYTSHLDENRIAFFNTISSCWEFLMNTSALLYTPVWVNGFFEGSNIHTAKIINSGALNELVWFKRNNELLSDIESRFIKRLYEKLGRENHIPECI